MYKNRHTHTCQSLAFFQACYPLSLSLHNFMQGNRMEQRDSNLYRAQILMSAPRAIAHIKIIAILIDASCDGNLHYHPIIKIQALPLSLMPCLRHQCWETRVRNPDNQHLIVLRNGRYIFFSIFYTDGSS